MASSALLPPLLPFIILSLLSMAALLDCGAARKLRAGGDVETAFDSIYRNQQSNSEGLGSLAWTKMRSKLKGFARDEIKDLFETLSHLEEELENNSKPQVGLPHIEMPIFNEKLFHIDEFDKQQEKHPGDHLLQRHNADATISYILGGY